MTYEELLDENENLVALYNACEDDAEGERLLARIGESELVLFHHPDRPADVESEEEE